jgi:hypothetical protein
VHRAVSPGALRAKRTQKLAAAPGNSDSDYSLPDSSFDTESNALAVAEKIREVEASVAAVEASIESAMAPEESEAMAAAQKIREVEASIAAVEASIESAKAAEKFECKRGSSAGAKSQYTAAYAAGAVEATAPQPDIRIEADQDALSAIKIAFAGAAVKVSAKTPVVSPAAAVVQKVELTAAEAPTNSECAPKTEARMNATQAAPTSAVQVPSPAAALNAPPKAASKEEHKVPAVTYGVRFIPDATTAPTKQATREATSIDQQASVGLKPDALGDPRWEGDALRRPLGQMERLLNARRSWGGRAMTTVRKCSDSEGLVYMISSFRDYVLGCQGSDNTL